MNFKVGDWVVMRPEMLPLRPHWPYGSALKSSPLSEETPNGPRPLHRLR
jgi:hypothetical protein